MESFSEVVKRKLKDKNLSVTQLSKSVNLSIPYMYDLLKGKRRWNEPTMIKVSDVLDILIVFEVKTKGA